MSRKVLMKNSHFRLFRGASYGLPSTVMKNRENRGTKAKSEENVDIVASHLIKSIDNNGKEKEYVDF